MVQLGVVPRFVLFCLFTLYFRCHLPIREVVIEFAWKNDFLFQVHKQGIALGRSVDLTKFQTYEELIAELDHLFDFNGELKSRNKNWMVVYTDDEGDMMLVGDDPWG